MVLYRGGSCVPGVRLRLPKILLHMVISNDASIILGTFASKSEVWSDKTQTGLCVHCVHALRLLEYQHRETCDAVEPQSGAQTLPRTHPHPLVFPYPHQNIPSWEHDVTSFIDHHCTLLHEHRHGCHTVVCAMKASYRSHFHIVCTPRIIYFRREPRVSSCRRRLTLGGVMTTRSMGIPFQLCVCAHATDRLAQLAV